MSSNMHEEILSINGLNKRYGRIHAVNDLQLSIHAGQVFGLLGPNGSGKTTTLGILLGIIRPDSGHFSWFGRAPSDKIRRKVGAILEQPIFYPYLSGRKNLEITATIKHTPFSEINEVLEIVGLSGRQHSRFKTYSLGMKQRLAIAAALLGKPKVLILDEPTNGLDPQGIAEIRSLILDIAAGGMTIILASHLLDEVQKICTHVAVLKQGKKLFYGSVSEVLQSVTEVEIAAEDHVAMKFILEQHPELILAYQAYPSYFSVRLKPGMKPEDLNRLMFGKGVVLKKLQQKHQSLEAYFLNLIKSSQS